jgi:beta-lactamase superfamily II metal-dependent hydrolase
MGESMKIRIALAAVGLALATLASPAAGQEVAPGLPPLIARFLDVGQGDGAWLTTPDGRTVLIDCGPLSYGRRLVVDLKAAGVEHISFLAPSHAHADHMGGCIEVVRQLPVDEVLWTGQTDTSQTWRTFWREVGERGLPVTTIRAGQVFDWGGGATATVYNPMSHLDGSSISEYDDSHVLLVEYLGTRLLFVGDLHSRGEQRALAAGLPPVHILKIAEHGSASGSSPEFLAAIHPRLAILSYATPNSFGLPSPTVLARLALDGIQALTTDEHGTITITVDGYSVAMEH